MRKCVKELPATLKSLPPRKSISVVEHERLKAQNEEMNELLDERDEEITRLQTILDEIDAGGDPKEVKKAHRSVSLKNAFEELWNKATEQLDMLSIDGQRAFFYLYSQDSHAAYSMINDERLNIAPDVRKKFILAGEGEPYKLGKKSDPISEAMNDLSDFLTPKTLTPWLMSMEQQLRKFTNFSSGWRKSWNVLSTFMMKTSGMLPSLIQEPYEECWLIND